MKEDQESPAPIPTGRLKDIPLGLLEKILSSLTFYKDICRAELFNTSFRHKSWKGIVELVLRWDPWNSVEIVSLNQWEMRGKQNEKYFPIIWRKSISLKMISFRVIQSDDTGKFEQFMPLFVQLQKDFRRKIEVWIAPEITLSPFVFAFLESFRDSLKEIHLSKELKSRRKIRSKMDAVSFNEPAKTTYEDIFCALESCSSLKKLSITGVQTIRVIGQPTAGHFPAFRWRTPFGIVYPCRWIEVHFVLKQ